MFSPDGRWIAYQSNETGRDEIYVQPFAGSVRSTLISTTGGSAPRWRGDGREIFYTGPDAPPSRRSRSSSTGGRSGHDKLPLTPGTRVGPYEIVSPLSAGGMGEVYRATDSKLGREVAVKLITGAVAHDADRLARFAPPLPKKSLDGCCVEGKLYAWIATNCFGSCAPSRQHSWSMS